MLRRAAVRRSLGDQATRSTRSRSFASRFTSDMRGRTSNFACWSKSCRPAPPSDRDSAAMSASTLIHGPLSFLLRRRLLFFTPTAVATLLPWLASACARRDTHQSSGDPRGRRSCHWRDPDPMRAGRGSSARRLIGKRIHEDQNEHCGHRAGCKAIPQEARRGARGSARRSTGRLLLGATSCAKV